MAYNIHPIFVHFPIAFLFIYSVIKILPLKRWFPKVSWRDIERILLVIGVGGAFAALATGETAEHLIRPNRALVNAHSTFATVATWLYCFLLAGELASILNAKSFMATKTGQRILPLTKFLERVFCDRILSAVIAFLGLVTLSLAGLLGGVIAYGLTADPFAPIVLKMLGITL